MSAHRRPLWHRPAAQHLRSLLASWRPEGVAAQRQRRVVGQLDAVIRVLPIPRRGRHPRHAAMPEIRGRAA